MDPSRPENESSLLIYDGNCGFCRIWIEYWKQLTGDRVRYAASQDVRGDHPQIPVEAYSKSVQFVRPDGSVADGARAVFETLDLVGLYEGVPGLAPVAEASYRFVAAHRDLFYQITRFTFGRRVEQARFDIVQAIFIRALAVIYAVAFGSLAFQIVGLVGSNGIDPVGEFLSQVRESFGATRFFVLPTLFWINSSNWALRGVCCAGVALSGMLLYRRYQRWTAAALYILYLSLVQCGQVFLGYQWDALLLETGFLAIFLNRSGSRVVPWLYRLLVFRLYFLSGVVKLTSGDPTWRNLSALQFHFHTQPLPTFLAWYADKLPAATLRASTAAMFAIELGAPFLIFAPRCWRLVGAWTMISLQVLIILTGNYTYFNWLTILLILWLFDDQAWRRLGMRAREVVARTPTRRASWIAAGALAGLGLVHVIEALGVWVPEPIALVNAWAAPFSISNPYGLFAMMTTERREIAIEGSDDGVQWARYEFPYKPGAEKNAPRWVALFQPRLDWQMWFAALGRPSDSPWLRRFAQELLEGSPEVTRLLARNPFPQHPPHYLRATTSTYTFTTAAERTTTGRWWNASPNEPFFGPVALRPVESR